MSLDEAFASWWTNDIAAGTSPGRSTHNRQQPCTYGSLPGREFILKEAAR
jgi:hypothetical protein